MMRVLGGLGTGLFRRVCRPAEKAARVRTPSTSSRPGSRRRAEAQTAKTLSPTYCLCSVGYVREMHERVLGRPVEVELADSVLRGGKRCRFRMVVG